MRKLTLAIVLLFIVSPTLAQNQTPAQRKAANAKLRGPSAKFPTPNSVHVISDLVYATYGDRQVTLDLYLPKKSSNQPIPCIMTIHGGGWTAGDKNKFQPIAAYLANQGFAAACIGYRLLPEVQFPAPVHDAKAATRWIRANASQFNIDPNKLGAIGGSAGAHLVSMLGVSQDAPSLEGRGGNPGVSSHVQAVVALAVPSDMSTFGPKRGASKPLAKIISPNTHANADSAPHLLIHSKVDGTVPFKMSTQLKAKLKAAHVNAQLISLEAPAPHAFWNFERWFDDTMHQATTFFNKELR